ncbi:hypothetical protein EMCRGX_G019351 [Ephydatia muelleri]
MDAPSLTVLTLLVLHVCASSLPTRHHEAEGYAQQGGRLDHTSNGRDLTHQAGKGRPLSPISTCSGLAEGSPTSLTVVSYVLKQSRGVGCGVEKVGVEWRRRGVEWRRWVWSGEGGCGVEKVGCGVEKVGCGVEKVGCVPCHLIRGLSTPAFAPLVPCHLIRGLSTPTFAPLVPCHLIRYPHLRLLHWSLATSFGAIHTCVCSIGPLPPHSGTIHTCVCSIGPLPPHSGLSIPVFAPLVHCHLIRGLSIPVFAPLVPCHLIRGLSIPVFAPLVPCHLIRGLSIPVFAPLVPCHLIRGLSIPVFAPVVPCHLIRDYPYLCLLHWSLATSFGDYPYLYTPFTPSSTTPSTATFTAGSNNAPTVLSTLSSAPPPDHMTPDITAPGDGIENTNPTESSPESDIITSGSQIALKILTSEGEAPLWLGCTGNACKASECPGPTFELRSTVLCQEYIFLIRHAGTSKGESGVAALKTGDQVVLMQLGGSTVYCNQTAFSCMMLPDCRDRSGRFSGELCGNAVMVIKSSRGAWGRWYVTGTTLSWTTWSSPCPWWSGRTRSTATQRTMDTARDATALITLFRISKHPVASIAMAAG